LEAAHVYPYQGNQTNSACNGLLLRIHNWIKEAEECLSRLEDKTALSNFQHIQQRFEFTVDDYERASSSKSAYEPTWIDQLTGLMAGAGSLRDFDFNALAKANDIPQVCRHKPRNGRTFVLYPRGRTSGRQAARWPHAGKSG
jgi:hypothetical protein